MKKRLGLILIPFFLVLVASSVLAVSDCPSCAIAVKPEEVVIRQAERRLEIEQRKEEHLQSLQELRQGILEKREANRLRIEEKRATIAARLTERKRERIREFYGRMTERFEAAINRLERLINRIESRLSKIEENDEDVDTATIREEVDAAKELLAEASAALSAAETSVEDILSSDDPKAMFTEVKGLLVGIKDQLKEVHRMLVHVIGDIKGLRVGQGGIPGASPEATASATPSATLEPSPEATPGGE